MLVKEGKSLKAEDTKAHRLTVVFTTIQLEAPQTIPWFPERFYHQLGRLPSTAWRPSTHALLDSIRTSHALGEDDWRRTNICILDNRSL